MSAEPASRGFSVRLYNRTYHRIETIIQRGGIELGFWDGQIIVLHPGRTGGALEFRQVLQQQNCTADANIAKTLLRIG